MPIDDGSLKATPNSAKPHTLIRQVLFPALQLAPYISIKSTCNLFQLLKIIIEKFKNFGKKLVDQKNSKINH